MRRAPAVAAAAALIGWNNVLLPALRLTPRGRAAAGTLVAVGATGAALSGGVSRADLGLGNVRAGLVWGGAAAAAPAVGYAAVLLAPPLHRRVAGSEETRQDFAEWVAVHIPFGTVVTEELLFRGVLTALTDRGWPARQAAAVRAAAFGLWHVRAARVAGDSVPGTVAFTAGSALVFDWLRTRSGSIVAPALLHLAVNVGGALLVHRLRVRTGTR